MNEAPHWSAHWELTVGLEVHAQLLTNSKAYSSDPNAYGDRPNTLVGPVSLGLPGTLPVPNTAVVDHAIMLGLACGCRIAPRMHYASKNYFYPDLPKGYQITQDTTPICTGGAIDDPHCGRRRKIHRAHPHPHGGRCRQEHPRRGPLHTLMDLNRAGVPLVEIVSEPGDPHSSQEAYDYLVEVRRLVRYLDICDGNMEEGSLRCDANISIRPKGTATLGTRTEVKNLNSFKNVQRAIEHEAQRQSEVLAAGGSIRMETRTFDAAKGIHHPACAARRWPTTTAISPSRTSSRISVSAAKLEAVRRHMPPLPRELRAKYTGEFGLSAYDAGVLTDDKETALYFETVVRALPGTNGGKAYKQAANWVMGDVRSWVNGNGAHLRDLPVTADRLAGLVALIESGKTSHTLASQQLFPLMVQETGTAEEIAQRHGLLTEAATDAAEAAMRTAMERYPDKVAAYRAGNKGLLGLFMGEVMKATKGKADPRRANEAVKRMLEQE
jgi:aspartyl-tRNA(Asn)/glutamyl-tRNA(Gln) amidotransferase subunit B